MKFVGIYLAVWILFIVAAGVMFAAGSISEMSLAIVGFVSASLVFVGLIGLLPWSLDNHYSQFSEMKRAVMPRTRVFVPAALQSATAAERPVNHRGAIKSRSPSGR